jgi:putative transposase
MTKAKNETIKATLKATKEKRRNQKCRVYEIKIDRSHLNSDSNHHLNMLFLEAKWLYNHILSQDDIFNLDFDYKIEEVSVKVKDEFEVRCLIYLSSHMKQSLIERTQDNIRGLHERKENGYKVGKLKYKSLVQSIPLKQFGNTYKIVDKNHIRIQGIKQKLRVRGLKQIPAGSDIANDTLICKHGDFYLSITTYQMKKKADEKIPKGQIGIDFGLARQMTMTSGIGIQYSVPITPRLRRLYRQLSKQEEHSNNWYKILVRINKEFNRIDNIKKDIKCKITSHLKKDNGIICFQNENVKAWQRIWGKKVLSTAIGGIISILKREVHTPVEIDRMYPSTKTCCKCGNIHELTLEDRIYVCENKECGNIMDRDYNSSNDLLDEGLRQIGAVRTELTPAEIESSTLASLRYLNSIPYVKASSVVETGSFTALA